MTQQDADVERFAAAVVGAIKMATEPLLARIALLEAREAVPGPPGPIGERGMAGPEGPAARDGRDGLPGLPGLRGEVGEKGFDGANGRDGTLDQIKIQTEDGGRIVRFLFKNGDPLEGGIIKTDTPVYRGVYQDGQTYERGDSVTWGGCEWHCNETTTTKPGPGNGSKAWTLKVKCGRDGRDGKDAIDPVPVVTVGKK